MVNFKEYLLCCILFFSASFATETQHLDLCCRTSDTIKPEVIPAKQYLSIDVSNSSLKYFVPALFKNQTQLISLCMSFNPQLKAYKDSPFIESSSLEVFNCIGCGFTIVSEKTFALLPKLRKLDLSFNKISLLYQLIGNPKLETLNLSSNEFGPSTDFQLTFLNLSSLQEVDLSRNSELGIQQSKSFIRSNSLKILHLNECNIKEIYFESFQQLPNLRELNLHGNHVVNVHKHAFTGNKHISSLNLENNTLTRLDVEVVRDSLTSICLDQNNFKLTTSYIKLYEQISMRKINTTEKCRNQNESLHFNWLVKKQQLDVMDGGISSAFISSYLSTVLFIELVFLFLGIFFLHRKSKQLQNGVTKLAMNDYKIYKSYKIN